METLQLRKLLGLNDSLVCSFVVGKELTHLDLRDSEGVTDYGLIHILKRCPNISYLNIAFLSQLTDKSLMEAAVQLKGNLVSIAISLHPLVLILLLPELCHPVD